MRASPQLWSVDCVRGWQETRSIGPDSVRRPRRKISNAGNDSEVIPRDRVRFPQTVHADSLLCRSTRASVGYSVSKSETRVRWIVKESAGTPVVLFLERRYTSILNRRRCRCRALSMIPPAQSRALRLAQKPLPTARRQMVRDCHDPTQRQKRGRHRTGCDSAG